jgi:hypothetical protein
MLADEMEEGSQAWWDVRIQVSGRGENSHVLL